MKKKSGGAPLPQFKAPRISRGAPERAVGMIQRGHALRLTLELPS